MSGATGSPSGASNMEAKRDPLPGTVPVKVAVDSGGAARGAARGAASGGAASGGAASGGADLASAEPGGAEPEGAEPGGAESEGAEPGGAESEGAESGGADPRGTASAGGPAGASPRVSPRREPLSPQQLREWFAQCTRLRSGAASAGGSCVGGTGAGGAGATSPGGARTRGNGAARASGVGDLGAGGARAGGARAGCAGAGGTGAGGAAVSSPGGARTKGTGATGAGGVGGTGARGAGAGDTGAGAGGPRARDPGAGGAGAGGIGAGGIGAGGAGAGDTGAGGAGAGGARAGDPGAEGAEAGGAGAGCGGARGIVQRRPFFVPPQSLSLPPPDSVLCQVLSLLSSTNLPPSLHSPPPHHSQQQLQPDSPQPAPSPYAEQTYSFTERHEPESRPASPVRAVHAGRCVPHPRPPPVPGTHIMALRPSSIPLRVPLPPPPASSLLIVPDPDCCRLDYATSLLAESKPGSPPSVRGECALGTDVLEDCQEDFECLAAAVTHLVAMLLTPEGGPNAPDIPTPRSYTEAITGTYADAAPPPGANIVDGMWIFTVKRPPGSLPVFKVRYAARGFSQRKGVEFFQTFSPTPKMTTLRVLLHVAAQCKRVHSRECSSQIYYELHSLDFSNAFLQGSLHEEIWLRRPPGFARSMMPAALAFAPSIAYLSLFLRTDTSLPPFYVLVYVLQRFGFRYSSRQSTPLPTSHSLSAPPLDESVEPSGPYPELVGCLMYLMTCTRPDLAYPLSILARYVASGRHRPEHWESAKRVLCYLCSTSRMGLVLGGRGPVFLTRHADASWVDDLAMQRTSQGYTFSLGSGSVSWRSTRSSSVLSSSCEAEIYAGAMAAQELRLLTYLLIHLGERPCSSPILYVDNKAMIALCQEHRLEHITKHIALRYFLARELQQHGQLRLAYVATRATRDSTLARVVELPRRGVGGEAKEDAAESARGELARFGIANKGERAPDPKHRRIANLPRPPECGRGNGEKPHGSWRYERPP
ncbi:unnamed protein product [Closterium sp. NIES-53]